jgi:hypothetical protein
MPEFRQERNRLNPAMLDSRLVVRTIWFCSYKLMYGGHALPDSIAGGFSLVRMSDLSAP